MRSIEVKIRKAAGTNCLFTLGNRFLRDNFEIMISFVFMIVKFCGLIFNGA